MIRLSTWTALRQRQAHRLLCALFCCIKILSLWYAASRWCCQLMLLADVASRYMLRRQR